MKLFNLKFSTLILRFYLMMGIVIGAFFIGYPWMAILSLPVFFSSMMGLEFSKIKTAPRRQKGAPEKIYSQVQHAAQ